MLGLLFTLSLSVVIGGVWLLQRPNMVRRLQKWAASRLLKKNVSPGELFTLGASSVCLGCAAGIALAELFW